MNRWLKLILPICLGGAAFVLNFVVVAGKSSFVAAKAPIQPGVAIDDSMLMSLSGDPSWKGTVITYEERAMLFGRPATRELKTGDVLFWRDVQPLGRLVLHPGESGLVVNLPKETYDSEMLRIGDSVGFVISASEVATPSTTAAGPVAASPAPAQPYEVVGPYRIVGVGARTEETLEKRSHDGSTVTIATKLAANSRLDTATSSLMEANVSKRVVAITVASRP